MPTEPKTSHTPGPWVLMPGGCIKSQPHIPTPRGLASSQIAVVTLGNDMTEEERTANAQLITAAPRLLDALRGLVQAGEVIGGYTMEEGHESPQADFLRALNVAAAAIAAAQGDSAGREGAK